MKRKYETVVIFDGSLPDDVVEKEQQKVENFLKENADFEKTDVWGKKNFAYPLGKKKMGNYFLFIYNGEGDISDKINKRFQLDHKIVRHMTVLYEEVKDNKPALIKPVIKTEEGVE